MLLCQSRRLHDAQQKRWPNQTPPAPGTSVRASDTLAADVLYSRRCTLFRPANCEWVSNTVDTSLPSAVAPWGRNFRVPDSLNGHLLQ